VRASCSADCARVSWKPNAEQQRNGSILSDLIKLFLLCFLALNQGMAGRTVGRGR